MTAEARVGVPGALAHPLVVVVVPEGAAPFEASPLEVPSSPPSSGVPLLPDVPLELELLPPPEQSAFATQ